MRLTLLPLLLLPALACASSPPPAPAPSPSSAAAGPFGALEKRLLAAKTLRVHARVVSGGRIESSFEGTFVAGGGERVRMDFQGSLGARPSDVRVVCDGVKMHGGSREHAFDFDAPPALREGIVVGFARMGLLHDVARLSEGAPPDYVDGSAAARLRVDVAARAPGEIIRGAPTERWTYMLDVDGGHRADGDLWTDAKTGLPVRRRLTVHFPEGDMQVGEEYDQVEIDGAVDDATFTVVD
jgi:hypothetical protein